MQRKELYALPTNIIAHHFEYKGLQGVSLNLYCVEILELKFIWFLYLLPGCG